METLWSFIGMVVLIAWFFGISYGAVLHGMLNFMIWVVIIGVILCVLGYILKPVPTNTPNKAPKRQKTTKPPKEHPLARKIAGWTAFFVASYLIADLFLIIIGIWETPHTSLAQLVLILLLPAVPFSIVATHRIIRKTPTKKHALKKAR